METAVEWLINELKCIKSECGNQTVKIEIKEKLLKQAKEMEKEQIIKAYIKGFCNKDITAVCNEDIRAKQYYNENFKSE